APLTPLKVAVDGSTKLTLASRSACGKSNPRSITPLTTLNIVVTPQIPSPSTMTASEQNARSLTSTRRPIRTSRRKRSIAELDVGRVRPVRMSGKGDGRRVAAAEDEADALAG